MSTHTSASALVRLNRQQLLGIMSGRLPEIVRLFDVMKLRLFGSAARDELRDDSDVDVLVEFNAAATYTRYMVLKYYLEAVLGRRVDLFTTKWPRLEFRPAVEQEAIFVA